MEGEEGEGGGVGGGVKMVPKGVRDGSDQQGNGDGSRDHRMVDEVG